MSKKLLMSHGDDIDNANKIDKEYNYFIFNTALVDNTTTVILQDWRAGDETDWDGITDWGDGTADTSTAHTYKKDGIYLVKTKYVINKYNNYFNGYVDKKTRSMLINCININKNITNAKFMFYYCENLTSLDLSWCDTSNITNMRDMFEGCSKLTKLNISSFNTSKVTDMSNMFNGTKVKSLDLSSFNTSNVIDMNNMFAGCRELISLDLSSFDTSKVKNMSNMFWGSYSLKTLVLSSFDTNKVTNMKCMFLGCDGLQELDLSSFNTSNVTNMEQMLECYNRLRLLDVSNFDIQETTNVNNLFGSYHYYGSPTYLTLDNIIMTNCNESTRDIITTRFMSINPILPEERE